MTATAESILLIITGSHDTTTDLLIPFLPADRIFRFNTDLFHQYKLVFDDCGFTLTDPTGRRCISRDVYKAYWRWLEWPIANNGEEQYIQAEVRYLVREMTNLLWSEGKFVLVEPGGLRRAGKLMQLIRAKQFFNVPSFRAGLNCQYPSAAGPEVVKSLSKSFPGQRVMFSTLVDPSQLAPEHPWFMQQYVEALYDVTVVVVRRRLFAFELLRDFLASSIDWRQIPKKADEWKLIDLSEADRGAIFEYMKDLRLDFGRLDFLRSESGRLDFCEINPNPQYAWLDHQGRCGLRSSVLEEISPLTERHPIPVAHPLARA